MTDSFSATPDTRTIDVIDAGRIGYEEGFGLQRAHHERILAGREDATSPVGVILLVEHPPIITVTKRKDAPSHILATAPMLEAAGVELHETDRGGDVTYHGPGQLVAYPIVDLNRIGPPKNPLPPGGGRGRVLENEEQQKAEVSKRGLNLHQYMRALEDAVINTCAHYGLSNPHREQGATGVWLGEEDIEGQLPRARKVCAMGVRVRRWVTMHGLALNVTTNLDHFKLIVPCGLTGRPVTSIAHERAHEKGRMPEGSLPSDVPPMDEVKEVLVKQLRASLLT